MRAAQVLDREQASELAGFVSTCSPGMVLIDVGAHFGVFSLAALHYGGETAKAIAVEPSSSALRMIRLQGELNHVANRLTVVAAAVSDHVGYVDMLSAGVIADGYLITPTGDHPPSDLTAVRSVTLDSLCDELGVKPSHLKIDVEGAESAVLRGGRRLLTSDTAPMLFLELHNKVVRAAGGDPSEAISLLDQYSYKLERTDGSPLERGEILDQDLIRIRGLSQLRHRR